MVRNKTIQVGTISALIMICYDARYLLLSIDGGNEGETNLMIKPWQKMKGSIGSNLFLNISSIILCLKYMYSF